MDIKKSPTQITVSLLETSLRLRFQKTEMISTLFLAGTEKFQGTRVLVEKIIFL